MTTAKLLSTSFLLALAGCGSKQVAKNEALAFLQAKNYAYVTRVLAIPVAALNRIAAVEGDTLRICDVESGLPIDLSDGPLDENGCRCKLNFALVGDSTCLLSYLKGGIGVHQVICCVKYEGALKYETYYPNFKEVSNVEQLNMFLLKQPNISRQPAPVVENNAMMLTPPPPWPKKLTKTVAQNPETSRRFVALQQENKGLSPPAQPLTALTNSERPPRGHRYRLQARRAT